jgi:peptide/nickel transport system permease protein
MTRIVLRWLATSVALIFGVSVLTFVLVSLTPGDAARTILGFTGTEETYRQLREQLGLNLPIWQQYGDWLAGAIRGDLGRSVFNGEPVIQSIMNRIDVTMSLIVGSVAIAAVAGVGLGTLSAMKGGIVGRLVDTVSLAGLAIPNFWFGLVLATLFGVVWRILPVTGYVRITDSPSQWFGSLVLPVLTLGLGASASVAKLTRDAMLEELGRDYILMLRAHGIHSGSVIFRHALRNAAIPVVTVLGLLTVGLLGGTVLVESVFVLPGLGGLAVSATATHDLPVIQGVAVTFTVVVVIVNLLVEILYAALNPRLRAS